MCVRKFVTNARVPKKWESIFEPDLKSMTLLFHGAPTREIPATPYMLRLLAALPRPQ